MATFARAGMGRSFTAGANMEFRARSFRTFYFTPERRCPPPSRHTIIPLLVPVLINFLQLQSQGNSVSPFENHQITMWVAVASLLLYCFFSDGQQRSSSSDHILPVHAGPVHRATVVFGSVSSAALASVLFPGSIRPVLFVVYALFLAGELMDWRVQVLRNWFRQRLNGNYSHDSHSEGAPVVIGSPFGRRDVHRRERLPV
ncbi:hypothetical protein NMG60_11030267 [Bertholletia excelsa]